MDEPATAPESIAQLCLQCFQKFNDLKSAAAGRSSSKNAALPEGFSISAFLDVFARFRIWTGNIGALQRGKSSLDHRLQHTDLRKEVTRLLRQTIAALNDGTPNHSEVRSRELDFVDIVAVISFVNGDREQQTCHEGEGIATAYSDSDEDSGSAFSSDPDPTETRSGIFTPEEEDPRLLTECSQLAIMLNDLIKSLLRLSLVIQRSSRRGKFVRSSRDKPYNTKFDVLHALESLPFAAKNQVLIERLGKANAQRRQWLAYRRNHNERLSYFDGFVLDQVDNIQNQQTASRADLASDVSHSTRPSNEFTMIDNSTTATTFYENSQARFDPGAGNETASDMSFSASSVSGRDKIPLEIPRMPSEAASGEPFECPFCFIIIAVANLQTWM